MGKIDLEKLSILKRRIIMSDMTRLHISMKIGIPYGTLSNYLNGFNVMPDHVERAIEECLSKANCDV